MFPELPTMILMHNNDLTDGGDICKNALYNCCPCTHILNLAMVQRIGRKREGSFKKQSMGADK